MRALFFLALAVLVVVMLLPRLAAWLFYTPMRWGARRDLRAFKRFIERQQ